jgi:glycosyltransferase involved in cell wall biosynthesis
MESVGVQARYRIVPNVVDTVIFHARPGFRPIRDPSTVKRILFVGILDPTHNKGVPFLLEALVKLSGRRRDWHLDIVGDGPARETYAGRVDALGLSGRITFHGLLTKPCVAERMRQAAFLVLPSLCETFSVVSAEAIGSGIPVLATRCGGPEEFVTPDVGSLVPAGDSEALCAGLAAMLDGLERYNPQALAAYASRRFSPEAVGRELDQVYRECLRER